MTVPPPATTAPDTPCQRRRSPSYYRRLKRRSNARQNLDSSFCKNVTVKECKVGADEVASTTEETAVSHTVEVTNEDDEILAVQCPNELENEIGHNNSEKELQADEFDNVGLLLKRYALMREPKRLMTHRRKMWVLLSM